jgi:hypothetical protein
MSYDPEQIMYPEFLELAQHFALIQKHRIQSFRNVHSMSVGSKELVQNFWTIAEFMIKNSAE